MLPTHFILKRNGASLTICENSHALKRQLSLSLLLNPVLMCLCASLYLGGSHSRKTWVLPHVHGETLKLQWAGSPQFSSLLFSQYLLA